MFLGRETAFLLLFTACIVEPPAAKSRKSLEERKRSALAAAPLAAKVGANFEDKIEVREVSIQPGQLRPGEQARVTATLAIHTRPDRDYQVFVHIENSQNPNERINADHAPIGGARPMTDWKPGENLRDEFLIYVPPNSSARFLNIWFGFWFPGTGERLLLRNPGSVRNDGQNRVLLAQVPVLL